MAATTSAVSANGQQQEATPHISRPVGIGEAAYYASEPANPNPRHFATQHVPSVLPPTANQSFGSSHEMSANEVQQKSPPHVSRPGGIGEAAYYASEPANPNPRHFATQHVSSALPPPAHQSLGSSHAMPANGQAGHVRPPAPPRRRSFLIRLEEEIEVCSAGAVDRLAEMCIVFDQSRGCHAGRRTSSRVQPAAAEEVENQPGGRRRGTWFGIPQSLLLPSSRTVLFPACKA
jgi:hypothetical protein